MKEKIDKLQAALEREKLMERVGTSNDPLCRDLWDWSMSPLGGGKHAAKFANRLDGILIRRFVGQELERASQNAWSDVSEDRAAILCYEVGTNRPVVVDRDVLTGHTLALGATGAGKTTFSAWLLGQLVPQGIRITFSDHKGEGRRFLRLFPDALVLRTDQERCNILSPVGNAEIYWTALFSELGKALNLHAETWLDLVEVMRRLYRNNSESGSPSLADLERVLAALAKRESRPKLSTAAKALRSLNAILGRMAHVRSAPDVEERYRVIIYEYGNLPARIRQFVAAVRFLRKVMKATAHGHEHSLKEIYLCDEGGMEFGQEFSGTSGSNYIGVHKRSATQIRSFGIGIFVGAQIGSELDNGLKSNVATINSMRCPNPRDAREAQQMLLLPDEALPEIMSLPVGQVYVRSIGFQRAVHGWFPKIDLGAYISDAELDVRMKSAREWLDQNTIFSPQVEEDVRPLSYQEILDEKPTSVVDNGASQATVESDDKIRQHFFAEHREFLREIVHNPDVSVSRHYRNLGWGGAKGTRVKTNLLEMGLILCTSQKSASGRPREILTLTEKGKDFLS